MDDYCGLYVFVEKMSNELYGKEYCNVEMQVEKKDIIQRMNI